MATIMINPNHLRIGNVISIANSPQTSYRRVRILGLKHLIYGEMMRASYEQIEPVKLTENWLQKFGFAKSSGTWSKTFNALSTKWSFEYGIFRDAENKLFRYHKDKKGIKYVHELQNFFFEMSEQELEIKY